MSFASQAHAAITSAPGDVEDELDASEDSDEWLNVDASSFDALLAQKMNLPTASTSKSKPPQSDAMDVDHVPIDKVDDGEMSDTELKAAEDMLAKEQAARLQDLAKKVEKFLGAKGDVDGARFDECVLLSLALPSIPRL